MPRCARITKRSCTHVHRRPTLAPRRLQSELMALMTSGETDVSAFPAGDDLFDWTGTIVGPEAGSGVTVSLSSCAR